LTFHIPTETETKNSKDYLEKHPDDPADRLLRENNFKSKRVDVSTRIIPSHDIPVTSHV